MEAKIMKASRAPDAYHSIARVYAQVNNHKEPDYWDYEAT